MARPRRVDMELVAQAQAAALEASDLEALRCAQAVLLPALLGATLEQTAAALGVGRATVPRLQARLRQQCAEPDAARPSWGGSPPSLADPEGGAQLLGTLGAGLERRGNLGRFAASHRVGAKAGAPCCSLHRVSHVGAPRLAQSGARHPASEE